MDTNRISDGEVAGVTVGGIVFDHVLYDAEADVLYLRVGDPDDAVDALGTAEGDGAYQAADGSLIGLTILNAKLRLEEDGKIELTFPEQKIVVTDLGDAFEHRLPKYVPDLVKIAGGVRLDGIEFEDVEYDRRLDVLYLRTAGTPVSDGASEEFNPLWFDTDGNLVAVTIAEARRLLEDEGKIVVTLPDGRRLEMTGLGPTLAVA